MTVLLYLKASVKRRFKRHLSLYMAMTSVFLAPMIFSVFRDSADLEKNCRECSLTQNMPPFIFDGAKPEYFSYIETVGFNAYHNVLLAVNIVILAGAAYLAALVYKSHLDAFDGEIKILSAIGANRKQIKRVFTLEYALIFILASVSAELLSSLLMCAIINGFLSARGYDYAAWLVFRVKPSSVALNVGVLFLSLSAARSVFTSLKLSSHRISFKTFGF